MGVVNKKKVIEKTTKNKGDLLQGSVINDELKELHTHPVIVKKIEEAKRTLRKV